MTWIIRRTDQGGGWVNWPGSRKSYTHRRDRARRFETREEAERERCEDNERVERL